MLRPRKSDQNLQTRPAAAASSSQSGGTVKTRTVLMPASAISAKSVSTISRFGELRPVAALWERAVGDAFDEMLLARRQRRTCPAPGPEPEGSSFDCRRRKRLRRNLFGFDHCHDRKLQGCLQRQPTRERGGARITGDHEFCSARPRLCGAARRCQASAVRMIVSRSETWARQPSSSAARLGSATSTGGSPGRRAVSRHGMGLPLTASAARITSRTE